MSETLIGQIITGVVSLLSLTITLIIKDRQSKLHKQINSRMDELLAINRREAAAENQAKTDAKEQDKK